MRSVTQTIITRFVGGNGYKNPLYWYILVIKLTYVYSSFTLDINCILGGEQTAAPPTT